MTGAGGEHAIQGSIGASLPTGSEGVGRGRELICKPRPAKSLDSQKVTPRPEKGLCQSLKFNKADKSCDKDNSPVLILIQENPGKGEQWSSIL